MGAAWALLIAIALNFVLVYIAVRRRVVAITVHRQLTAPLIGLAIATIFYLLTARYSLWVALTGGSVLYLTALARSDGRQLFSFLATLFRKSA